MRLPVSSVYHRAVALAKQPARAIGQPKDSALDSAIESRFTYLLVQLASCRTGRRKAEAKESLYQAIAQSAGADLLVEL